VLFSMQAAASKGAFPIPGDTYLIHQVQNCICDFLQLPVFFSCEFNLVVRSSVNVFFSPPVSPYILFYNVPVRSREYILKILYLASHTLSQL
jgi:hypothetical protein